MIPNSLLEKFKQTLQALSDALSLLYSRPEEVKSHPINLPDTPVTQNLPRHASKIKEWALAIQHAEGGKIQDLNTRFKNPGNLKYTSLTASLGGKKAPPTADGRVFCYFDTYEQGFNALCEFLTLAATDKLKSYRGTDTLEHFCQVYAEPPSNKYALSIATALGVSTSTPIRNLL